MNDLQKGILTLLKSAVTGEKYALPEGFSLEEALPFIKRQHIVCLCYTGAANCGVPTSDPVMQQLFPLYCRLLMHSERQMQAAKAIFRAFDQAGVDYLPLKGCNMKALYPKPELRWMSDADILIRTGQYERIRPIMQGLGFAEQVESDHELIWHSDKLHVELHKRLIPSYNRDYYAYFGDGWKLARPECGTRYGLSPEDAFIFQFIHFAKHYRDGGIGCRYVLDLWVYRRANPGMDEAYICSELKKLGVSEFYRNMLDVMAAWFEGAAPTDKTEFITEFIFKGGSWGSFEDHALAMSARGFHADETAHASRLKLACRMAFPSAKSIEGRYAVLKKCPWLLPVIWPVRWVSVLLFRRQNLRSKQRELQIVTDERVAGYQQALSYVGLGFDFEEPDR